MNNDKSNLQVIKNIEITDIADEGRAVARVNDLVVLLRNGVPGDVVDIHPVRWKKNYMEAEITTFTKLSGRRTEPVCEHFGICGGCKWQNMNYESQLHYKQKQVEECFRRIAKINVLPVLPIIGSKEIFFYRNKLEFTFSSAADGDFENPEIQKSGNPKSSGVLGFHKPGRFDQVLNINNCHLQRDPSNAIRNEVRKFALENNFSFYDCNRAGGLLRNLIIRITTTGEVMVILSFFYDDEAKRISLLNHLKEKFPDIKSLMFVINPKGNDTIFDREVILFSGSNHINEKIGNLQFRIGPKSFFQVNIPQSEKLFRTAVDFAGLRGTERVYDLYTGNGCIALFASLLADHVTGIEYIDETIQDARMNAQENRISNVDFFSGDIKKVFTAEFIGIHGKPDVVITDPPRSGMVPKVIERILLAGPQRIVYVSCNPATQARDVALMSEKYYVDKIQPVDMFPHTQHVESVALLIKK
ncbi:MAG: 23S rRNA (uracil(1939)-C(5))-methyltransferase RlmD [Bacteroidetes bacterium]|nr:23S rRNA (uracil(1939)-C(5))-methyltransferase RlmD [Bacteroidota bacterium]